MLESCFVVLDLYIVNAYEAKEISEIDHYQILLNVLQLLIVSVVVAERVGNTLWQSLSFSLPCLPNIFLLTFITNEAVFQFKGNLNIFKGVVIIYQEIVATISCNQLQLFLSLYIYIHTKIYQKMPKSDYPILGVEIPTTRKCFSTLSWQPNWQLWHKLLKPHVFQS